jgi:hypothetical protein
MHLPLPDSDGVIRFDDGSRIRANPKYPDLYFADPIPNSGVALNLNYLSVERAAHALASIGQGPASMEEPDWRKLLDDVMTDTRFINHYRACNTCGEYEDSHYEHCPYVAACRALGREP